MFPWSPPPRIPALSQLQESGCPQQGCPCPNQPRPPRPLECHMSPVNVDSQHFQLLSSSFICLSSFFSPPFSLTPFSSSQPLLSLQNFNIRSCAFLGYHKTQTPHLGPLFSLPETRFPLIFPGLMPTLSQIST